MDNCPSVGDVISSPRYGEGMFVVTSTQSCGQGDDVWDDSTSINLYAKKLNDDGSFNPNGQTIDDHFYDGSVQEPFVYGEEDLDDGWTIEDINEANQVENKRYQERVAEHDEMFSKDSFRDVVFHGHMTMTFVWEPPNTLLP